MSTAATISTAANALKFEAVGSGVRRLEPMDAAQHLGHRVAGHGQVIVGLQVDPALRIGAEEGGQAEELARIAENVAVIEARTQPENKHFTVMGYANLVGMPVDTKTAATLGRRCAALSRQRGLIIGDVSDPRFGNVHSYHESVLQDVLPIKFKEAA